MKDKIIVGIAYLFSKKTVTYLFMFLFTGYMIFSWIEGKYNEYIDNQIKIKTEITNLDIKKQKFLDSKVLEVKPIYIEANNNDLLIKTLKDKNDFLYAKAKLIETCIDGVRETLGTTNRYDCNKSSSLIPTASAEETIYSSGNIIGTDKDIVTMKRICTYGTINGRVSPICNNKILYDKLKLISESKGVDFYLMLGISQAESHIGANYAPGCDSSYNNLGGVKARKLDNGKTIKDQPIPDSNGCRLYKFDSIEDYWNSKANSLKMGYIDKQCSTPECISKWYVKGNGIVKPAWSDRVRIFYN